MTSMAADSTQRPLGDFPHTDCVALRRGVVSSCRTTSQEVSREMEN